MSKPHIVILGAGFGGLELSASLSEALGDTVEISLIDKSAAFVFGFSKLDLMFGRTTLDGVRLEYGSINKPGVRFLQQTITAIDPIDRRVTTDSGVFEADVLVVALGAEYDLTGTPGLVEGGNEFYTVAGAARLRDLLPEFRKGRAIVGVCAAPFKCPPAPSEAALLLHEYLTARGVMNECEISVVLPFSTPVPPSPDTSRALIEAFAERGIEFVASRRVDALDAQRRLVILDDGSELPYDLFLGIPKHRVPEIVAASGMIEDGWVPVNPATLETKFPRVYAIGDVTGIGVPMAGVFAEAAAKVVAASLIAELRGGDRPAPFAGAASCYVEFGEGQVGRVDVDFLTGPRPTGNFQAPSAALVAEKANFGKTRRARWFGRMH